MSIQAAREEEHQRHIEGHRKLTAPILAELRAAGFDFASLDDLRRSRTRYEGAIPILISWLPKPDAFDVKESIVRTLSVPWARGIATKPLLEEFYKAPVEASSLRWAIGNAMEAIADPSAADEILKIVADPSNGSARQMFVLALGKLRHHQAVPVLLTLLKQEEVAGHAVNALGKLKATEARDAIEGMVKHPQPWVRKEAKAALAKISKVAVKP
jgi:hypothetical protein